MSEPDFDQIAGQIMRPIFGADDLACTTDHHWWRRTPPVPSDPPGHVESDARCLCGAHNYSEQKTLLDSCVKIGTFVAAAEQTRVVTGEWLAEQLRQVWNARGAADIAKVEAVFLEGDIAGPDRGRVSPGSPINAVLTDLDRALRSLDR